MNLLRACVAKDLLRVLRDPKAEREAVFSKSPTSLQAVNLAEQARGMIFPVFDPDRQRCRRQRRRCCRRLPERRKKATQLPHPPYSPDLSSSAFFYFLC